MSEVKLASPFFSPFNLSESEVPVDLQSKTTCNTQVGHGFIPCRLKNLSASMNTDRMAKICRQGVKPCFVKSGRLCLPLQIK